MAGLGSRFSEQGFDTPKPLIEFFGKSMIRHVVEHLNMPYCHHIFLCQKSHVKQFNLHQVFSSFLKHFTIVEVDGYTEGAACTVLCAKHLIDNDNPIMIVNSDQLLHWNPELLPAFTEHCDGLIYCFIGEGPKWSYVKLDEFGDNIIEVAEKVEISNYATAGMYFWNKGSDFVKYAEQMIMQDKRVNGEFYVAPVYNEAIQDYKYFEMVLVDRVDQVGTPEELKAYLEKIENVKSD